MSLITPFPEADSPDLERYALRDGGAIAALLDDLRKRRVMVTLYYDDASGFTVGHVLDVDVARGSATFDAAGDASARAAVAAAQDVVGVAFLDSTKIQFTLSDVQSLGEGDAFRFPLPDRVLCIQRRSALRREPPGDRPAWCRLPVPGRPDAFEPVRVLDISAGGLAVLVTPQLFELARDQMLTPCYLDLPDVGQVGVSIRVRYLEAWPSDVGGRRCGCEFVELSSGARGAIERYIGRLETRKPPASPAPGA